MTQGSILGPLLLLLLLLLLLSHINDLSDNLESIVKIFADDFSLFSVVSDLINTSQYFNNSTVQQISTQNHLGIHFDEELTFKHHINGKINKSIRVLELFINNLPFFCKAQSRLW